MIRVRLIDGKVRRDPDLFLLQTLMAFALIAAIVLVMGALTKGALGAALGASAFILSAMPAHRIAGSRSLIAGHKLSLAVGLLCAIPLRLDLMPSTTVTRAFPAAAAASLALFGLVATDSKHPSAAGNALDFAVTPIGASHALFTLGPSSFARAPAN